MVYTVKLDNKVLYRGTSAEDAVRVEKHHQGAKSYTEGVEIEWLRREMPVRKPIKAVARETIRVLTPPADEEEIGVAA